MKALVFSDIHGSLSAARFIADEIECQRPDMVLLLGDILYHGPRNPLPDSYDPRGVSEILNKYAHLIISTTGNCDSEVDTAMLGFPVAPEFCWVQTDTLRIFLTHGHKYSPKNLPTLRDGDIFLFGHTHVPQAEIHNGVYLCNPGSLSLPKEGHPESYAIIENAGFSVMTRTGEVYLQLTYC